MILQQMIDKAIKRAEVTERKNIAHEATVEKQKQRIDTLDRKSCTNSCWDRRRWFIIRYTLGRDGER